jgi:hypothetical protein
MITRSKDVYLAGQKEMHNVEHDFGHDIDDVDDKFVCHLTSLSISFLNASNCRFLTYCPCLSTETHAVGMDLYRHTCFAFLSPIMY